jgi:predicted dehydrogenase/nucleoside-diphosphate-sugar epimerase
MSAEAVERKLRVGIVGAGYVSSYHIRAVQSLPFATVVGIADPDQEKAHATAARFGVPAVYRTLDELLREELDVVHVLTPPASHASVSIRALEAGAHVFVEKPMAETPEECSRMIETARRAGRILSVDHSARMDPVVLRALEIVKTGGIGDVLSVTFLRSSNYMPFAGGKLPAHYAKGSYPFQDLGVHGLYTIEAFLGPAKSLEVKYRSSRQSVNLLFDEWFAYVDCERGGAQMYISWNINPMQNEFVVHGTKGVLHIDAYLQTLIQRRTYPAPKPIQRVIGGIAAGLYLLRKVPMNALLFATKRLVASPGIHVSVVKFYEALQRGEAPPVPAEEGRRVIELIAPVSLAADQARDAFFAAHAPAKPARVLLTGAQGFLGRRILASLLKRSETVRVLIRRQSPALEFDSRLDVVYGDLGDPEAVDQAIAGVETVYHAGAAMRGGPMEFAGGTTVGTRNVIDSCLRHGVKRMVYVSSMSVLDQAGHGPGTPVSETSPYEPNPTARGLYTQTKLEAETMVLDAVRQHGLPAVVLRPGQIFGPGAEHVPPSGAIGLAGRWIIVGSGRLALPLVYVDDVVDALLLAEERPEALGQVIQLVDPEYITQEEYAAVAQRSRPDLVRPVRVPLWLMFLAASGVEILGKLLKRAVPLTRYRVRSLRPLHPCDITRAQEVLGWTPRVGVRQGLRITYPEQTP